MAKNQSRFHSYGSKRDFSRCCWCRGPLDLLQFAEEGSRGRPSSQSFVGSVLARKIVEKHRNPEIIIQQAYGWLILATALFGGLASKSLP
jgi:hypothetical protein